MICFVIPQVVEQLTNKVNFIEIILVFFIVSKTRSKLKSIRSFSKGEEGFLLIPGEDRQLTLHNAHKFKSCNGSNHFTFNTALIPSMGQVGAGHIQEGSSGASPHSVGLGLSDFRPILNRKGGRDIQPHLMIIGGSSDFSIYTSAREIWTPTIYVSGTAIIGGHFDYDFPGGERPAIKVRYNGTSAN